MMGLQVGDRVECHYSDGTWDGELGTIVGMRKNDGCIAVCMDQYHEEKHSCNGLVEDGYGWYFFDDDELILIERPATIPNLDDLI